MSESTTPLTRDGVLGIIKSKAWYGLDPATGSFDWKVSVGNIASELRLNPNSVNYAIAQAFTPNCLSQVALIENSENNSPISLLGALQKIGIKPHIWTAGDPEWQRIKFERSGASEFVDPDHYHSSTSNKSADLRKIIESLGVKGRKHIIVVDDKENNLKEVRQLAEEYGKKRIKIGDYLMKLKDGQADATAFYQWLQQQLKEVSGEPIELVLDFDGVVADIDGVLFGPATDNLWSLLDNEKTL